MSGAPSLYLVSGDDDFARKRRAREIAEELAGGDPAEDPSLEIVAGDGEAVRIEEVLKNFLEAWRTPPFLADHKTVWLRHLPDLSVFEKPREGSVAAAVAAAMLAPPEPDTRILIDGPGFDQRTSFAKKLKAAGAAVEMCSTGRVTDRSFAANRRREIDDFMARRGKRIAADAAGFLSEAAGSGSGNLANELEKLLLYVGDAERVTLRDCLAVVSRTPETMGWMYVAAVTSGDVAGALRHLNTMLESGNGAEMRVAAALSTEYQKQIQTRLALEELGLKRVGPNTFSSIPEEVRSAHPGNPLLGMHPFRAFKVCEAAMATPPAELARRLTMVRDASLAIVSGRGEPRIILEELSCRLARRPGRDHEAR